ncbi:hypothetical protein BJY01DRAFT_222473 [Aspergillus pseudoustus]|uniref:Annexin n=1 Tax=Aspergillus pseudoustus TaxID=1810923 RepID=A0ABR4J7U6_9EURO
MSLQVNDPRSRGRSKSPSGRTRERSTSRDPRLEPSSKSKYLAADLGDDKARTRSRSRGASPLRGYRKSSRYDSDSEHEARDSYTRSRSDRDRDHYYHSDSGDDRGATKRSSQRYSQAPQRRSAQLNAYSDEDIYSDSDSEDDHLVYGDVPRGIERAHYGYKGTTNASAPPSQKPLMTGAIGPGTNPRSSAEAVGGHARYSSQTNPPFSGPPPSQSTWAAVPDCEKPGFVPPTSQGGDQSMPGAFPSAPSGQPNVQYMSPGTPQNQYPPWNAQTATSGAPYTAPVSAGSHQRGPSGDPNLYANPPAFQYAQVNPNVKYSAKPATTTTYAPKVEQSQYGQVRYSATPQYPPTSMGAHDRGPQYVEVAPGTRPGGRPTSLSISTGNSLTVGGSDPDGRPPLSPMLEPYKGTYQSISPMPSPILIAPRDDDISDLEPLDNSTDSERRRRRKSKKSKDEGGLKEPKSDRSKRGSSRVRHERHDSRDSRDPDSLVLISPHSSRRKVSFYDATEDALALRDALSHTRNIDTKVLTQILPHLTSDEILDLRKEYKNHVKISGKGVNLAKHVRVKLGNGSLGKVCYATALGRWESEAFWANCYYQSGSSRRELLIESLFGRSNGEMREIKESFKDSRYTNSLEKCMKAELKADKFRTAVLLALEESRQSERDAVDPELVHRDVQALHAALVSRNGGETAMIYIIVRRSDSHLREVLRAYEKIYQQNFAREMIQKSQNLVGETLAHILNGAINRPMRDALLLHQALHESRSGKERSELLISRLVRLHWEPRHLENVKLEYRRRYGARLEEAIAEEILPTTGGSDWGEFCIQLAQSSKTLAGKGRG